MKKILIIITQSELGGAQRWVYDAATNLNKLGYKIIVAAGAGGPLLDNLKTKNIETFSLPHLTRNINLFNDLVSFWKIYKLIKKVGPDVLQLCSTKAGLLGGLAGQLAKIPKIIYRIGGWSFNDPRPAWQNKIFLAIERISAPLRHIIIVNSRHDYNQALDLKIINENRLRLLYNGIDIASFKNQPSIKINHNKSDINVACIANFYPTKGLDYLLCAVLLMVDQLKEHYDQNLSLTIIGDGRLRPKLEEYIKKHQMTDYVKLAGKKDDPWQYLAENRWPDIFIIPSIKEGLPYVLLEAMANQLPIIATKVGGIPEVITHDHNGFLVDKEDPLDLTLAIRDLATNPELRTRLAAQAGKDIEKYELNKMINEYIKIIS